MKGLPFVLLLFATASAHAQEARLEGKLSPTLARAIDAMVDSAREEALPTRPLLLKTLEGVSKGAPEPRIIVVVGQVLASLRASRAVLGPDSPEADVTAGAAALRAGVSVPALGRLRDTRPPGALVVPLGILTDLVSGGMSPGAAEQRVIDLARTGASDADFVSMGREFADSPAGPRP